MNPFFTPSVFKNDYVTLFLKDGIIHAILHPNIVITLNLAKKLLEARLRFSNGITRPLFADMRGAKYIEDEARDFLASEEACRYASAAAILIENYFQKLLANFYLAYSKPRRPTKIFTEKANAVEWLSTFK